MSNRSAKLAAAMFATALVGANLATTTQTRAQAAADNCLSAPKGATPAGSHWYYRIDRATKRQCWYLREENDKASRAAPPQDSPSTPAPSAASAAATPETTKPAPPQPGMNARKSVSDARAEWPTPQGRVEQDPASNIGARTTGATFAPTVPPSPVATAPDADASSSLLSPTSSSLVTSRWPDAAAANSFDNTRTASADPPPSAPSSPGAPSAPATKAKPRTAMPAVALASADSSIEKQSGSMQMLLLVMAGALVLAGITASLVFRFGRALQPRREVRRDRRVIWDTVPAGRTSQTGRSSPSMRPSPSMSPGEDLPMWRTADSPWRAEDTHDPRAPDDPQRRVTELLARLARSAQA